MRLIEIYISILSGLLLGIFVAYSAMNMYEDHRCTIFWNSIQNLPVGEFAILDNPTMIIQKTGPRELAYRPINLNKQQSVDSIFATPVSTTTSTTLGRK